MNKPRDYTRATEYENSPEQVRHRMARNRARAAMIKAGLAHKGDGKDVDHKRPLDSGGSNARSNLRVRSVAANRGYRRDSKNHPI
jgi:predicted transcriptional regulator